MLILFFKISRIFRTTELLAMETILIEVKNNKAYQFIKFLEELNFLKILTKDSRKSKKISEQFSGKLSKDTANKMIEELNQSRGEWEQRGI